MCALPDCRINNALIQFVPSCQDTWTQFVDVLDPPFSDTACLVVEIFMPKKQRSNEVLSFSARGSGNYASPCIIYVCVWRTAMQDDGTERNPRILVDSNIQTPDGLAFDWIHENLYWTDTGKNCIEVMSIQNPAWRKELITENLDEPRAIVVDPRDNHGLVSAALRL